MKNLLVLGVGNILLMDEGIGVHAVNELLKEKWSGEIDFIDGGTFTQDIFYLFQEYKKILVLDIVKAGNKPGTIYHLKENDLRKDKNQLLSLHDIDLLDSLIMAGLAGNKPELFVLGIEPKKIDWDIELSPTLKKKFPTYLKAARNKISTLLD
ncbi:MAG: hydrogenase [Desulfobacteraceae bacterium 4572_130]|nr:MAG: hydrogenase [Desulfobacteraceae bacterium 4572_130]